jgi:hypothetical protein
MAGARDHGQLDAGSGVVGAALDVGGVVGGVCP